MLIPTVGDTPILTGSVNFDVTGASLAAHLQRPDATIVTKAVTIVTPLTGRWSCALGVGDLNQEGDYLLDIKVTFAGGAIVTVGTDADARDVRFRVRKAIA